MQKLIGTKLRICEISDVLQDLGDDNFNLKFPACFQVCDYNGESIIASAWPGIVKGSYSKTGLLLNGYPERAATDGGLNFAVLFPNGIRLGHYQLSTTLREALDNGKKDEVYNAIMEYFMSQDESTQKRLLDTPIPAKMPKPSEVKLHGTSQPSILILRKDIIFNGNIVREVPRSFQMTEGEITYFL